MEYSQRNVLGSRKLHSVSPVLGSIETTCLLAPATVKSFPFAYTGVERGGVEPKLASFQLHSISRFSKFSAVI